MQDVNKISTRLLREFHYLNTYRYLELSGSNREGPNNALFRAIEGNIWSSIGKLWSHRYRLNGQLFPDWSIRSIISIPGYINIARVSLELFADVCDDILICFSLFSLFHVQQIGCHMAFCITACVIAFIMFICYCAALDEFATIIRCYNNRVYNSYNFG